MTGVELMVDGFVFACYVVVKESSSIKFRFFKISITNDALRG
jgi:hypothetical protein